MKFFFYNCAFVVWKTFVRPFKRTPMRWVAIIFNKAGQLAVEEGHEGRRLPSGDLTPGQPIPYLCRRGLGLEPSQFSDAGPFRLVGIDGKGRRQFTFYYSGEILTESALAAHRDGELKFIDRSGLGGLLPEAIAKQF